MVAVLASVHVYIVTTEKGHDFFFGGYLHKVKICKESGMWYIQSKYWASQRKTVKYNQKVVISEEGVEYAAYHACPESRNGGFASMFLFCYLFLRSIV